MSTINLDNKTILVTGAAGFIGSNLVKRIYQEAPSATVVGIDNMNDYYDVALKEFRLNELAKYPTFTFDALAVPVEPAPALPFRGLWPPTRVSMQGRISSHWFFGRCCTHYPMQFPDVGILLSREHTPFSSPRFLASVFLSAFSEISAMAALL